MKKRIYFIPIVILFLFSACSTSKVVDNTFSTIIKNESNYEINIDGVVVPAGTKVEHKFPLHNNELYNGSIIVKYKILLTDSIYYYFTDKIFIEDNQKEVEILEKDFFIEDSYMIIQNWANDTFNITDALKENIFPCYKNGIINDSSITQTWYCSPNSTVVCKIEHIPLFVSDTLSKKEPIPLKVPYKKGYIYRVILENERINIIAFCSLQDFLINFKSTPGPASIANYAPSSIKIKKTDILKPVALGLGAEANRNSREDFIAPGISFSFDYNAFKKVSLGFKMLASYDVSAKNDNLLILEPLAFLRVYMVYHSGEPGTGVFLEGLGGVSIVSSINSDSNIIPNGGLGVGYRLPLKWFYIEPEIRFGYPYTYGASVNLGFRF